MYTKCEHFGVTAGGGIRKSVHPTLLAYLLYSHLNNSGDILGELSHLVNLLGSNRALQPRQKEESPIFLLRIV